MLGKFQFVAWRFLSPAALPKSPKNLLLRFDKPSAAMVNEAECLQRRAGEITKGTLSEPIPSIQPIVFGCILLQKWAFWAIWHRSWNSHLLTGRISQPQFLLTLTLPCQTRKGQHLMKIYLSQEVCAQGGDHAFPLLIKRFYLNWKRLGNPKGSHSFPQCAATTSWGLENDGRRSFPCGLGDPLSGSWRKRRGICYPWKIRARRWKVTCSSRGAGGSGRLPLSFQISFVDLVYLWKIHVRFLSHAPSVFWYLKKRIHLNAFNFLS